MWTKKETVLFIAGAMAFHTLNHILIPMFMTLPIQFGRIILTSTLNMYTIIISALITIGLILWASKLK